jgi:hypothetical protein
LICFANLRALYKRVGNTAWFWLIKLYNERETLCFWVTQRSGDIIKASETQSSEAEAIGSFNRTPNDCLARRAWA